ncbi:MAG: DUF5412 family protein [Clostridiaceae bacterium]
MIKAKSIKKIFVRFILGIMLTILMITLAMFCYVFFVPQEMSFPKSDGSAKPAVISSNKEYFAEVHEAQGKGYDGANMLRVDITNTKTTDTRFLYLSSIAKESNVEWIDDTHISINGKSLNAFEDKYYENNSNFTTKEKLKSVLIGTYLIIKILFLILKSMILGWK